jgi:hypothetical protein
MSKELLLVRQGNFNIAVYDYTLAAQSRVDAGVYSTIYKVFLLIGDFPDVIFAFINIDMAGAATTNSSAIMLKFYAIVEAYVQHRFAFNYW